MRPKKPLSESFTSLRIIGRKAQTLLGRVRKLRNDEGKPLRDDDAPPVGFPAVCIHLPFHGVILGSLVVVAIAAGVAFLYLIRDNLVLLLLAIFIAAIVDPGVKAMGRFGIPRGVAVLIQYFVALFLFVFLLVSLIPIIADQIQEIARFTNQQANSFLASPTINLPFVSFQVNQRLTTILQSALSNMSIGQFTDALSRLSDTLSSLAQGSLTFAARIAGSVFSFFVSLIIVLVMAFFLQIEKTRTIRWLRSFLPIRIRRYTDEKGELIHWKLSQWVKGQILLSGSIFMLVFLALVVLRMQYALTLAILAAFTELIPVVGIIIAAVPAVLIGITQKGLLWGILLACVYYIIQWCEGNLLVPLVMKRTVGISPIAVILAMLVGASFPSIIHPILGIMLAIPGATIIAIFFEDWEKSQGKRGRKTSGM
jgi:putative permease